MPTKDWWRYDRSIKPVTWTLIGLCLAFWLLVFLGVPSLALVVSGSLLSAPWTLLTYFLFTPTGPFGLLLSLYALWWLGGGVEASWGSRKFLVFFLASAALSRLSFFLGSLALGLPDAPMLGLWYPLGCVMIAWTLLNPGAVILLMFVIPVTATVMRYLTLGLAFLGSGGPLMGLFALAPLLLAWWYTARFPGRSLLPAISTRPRQRSSPRSGVKVSPIRPEPVSALEQEIDRILDKVRLEGMNALTEEERARLDAHSVRLRQRG